MTTQEALKRKIEVEIDLRRARAARDAFLKENQAVFERERALAGTIHGLVDELTALHKEHPELSVVHDALRMAPKAAE